MSSVLSQNIYIVVALAVLLCTYGQNTAVNKDLVCHDPDAGGTVQNLDRRFIILGSEDGGGAGLGNILVFYPAAYYFAALTGRDIIIADHSVIGEMCHILQCGFPFVSEMALAYPGILTNDSIKSAPTLKKGEFTNHLEGKSQDALVVRSGGYLAHHGDWWVYFVNAVDCVAKITGCDPADVPCAERHAFQRLIRGPFRRGLTSNEESRIHGVQDNMKHALLTLPHSFAPRFDAAIHLRTQFQSFEDQQDLKSETAQNEVKQWLESGEGAKVFEMMENKLLEELGKDMTHRSSPKEHHGLKHATTPTASTSIVSVDNDTSSNTTFISDSDPIYVYLAADNEEVKEAFAKVLETKHLHHEEIRVMRVKTKGIFHIKNLSRLKTMTNDEGLLDLVFDWYSLSLSNIVLAWRKGGTGLISTFVQSASRVSGTTARTNVNKAVGKGGIGTIGVQLQGKGNGIHWNPFWHYGFPEDYRKPGDRKKRMLAGRNEYELIKETNLRVWNLTREEYYGFREAFF